MTLRLVEGKASEETQACDILVIAFFLLKFNKNQNIFESTSWVKCPAPGPWHRDSELHHASDHDTRSITQGHRRVIY